MHRACAAEATPQPNLVPVSQVRLADPQQGISVYINGVIVSLIFSVVMRRRSLCKMNMNCSVRARLFRRASPTLLSLHS